MGNCGCNCTKRNIDIRITTNNEMLTTVSLNIEKPLAFRSKSFKHNSPIPLSSSKNSTCIKPNYNSTETVYNIQRKGPILLKLQTKKNFPQQFL